MLDLNAARGGSIPGSDVSAGLKEAHWLCPVEDRRLERFSLGNYLLLVDYTGRLFREGKAGDLA